MILSFTTSCVSNSITNSTARYAILGRVDKAHPAMDCGELHEAEEAFGGLVVARRDAAKLLQEAHHALDAVAPGIAASVQRAGRFAVRLPRNNGARAAQVLLHESSRGWGSPSASRSDAAAMSAVWPGVRCKVSGTPFASDRTWILVETPPRDRPNAFKWLPLFWSPRCAGTPPLAHACMRCRATGLRCCRSFGPPDPRRCLQQPPP
jgi:hypothetical protein